MGGVFIFGYLARLACQWDRSLGRSFGSHSLSEERVPEPVAVPSRLGHEHPGRDGLPHTAGQVCRSVHNDDKCLMGKTSVLHRCRLDTRARIRAEVPPRPHDPRSASGAGPEPVAADPLRRS
jgi:hypothetical protein